MNLGEEIGPCLLFAWASALRSDLVVDDEDGKFIEM
jgi:hypothetical protein